MNDKQKSNYIIELVSHHFVITIKNLKENRNRKCSDARKIAIGLIRKETDLTMREIGMVFNLDHSTIVRALGSFKNLIETDKDFENNLYRVEFKYLSYRIKTHQSVQ